MRPATPTSAATPDAQTGRPGRGTEASVWLGREPAAKPGGAAVSTGRREPAQLARGDSNPVLGAGRRSSASFLLLGAPLLALQAFIPLGGVLRSSGGAALPVTLNGGAALLALLAGACLLRRFCAQRTRAMLMLGMAYVVMGAGGGLDTLVSFAAERGAAAWVGVLAQLTAGAHTASTLFFAILLGAAPLARAVPLSENVRRDVLSGLLAALGLALVTLAAALQMPSPYFAYADRVIARPLDLVLGIALLGAWSLHVADLLHAGDRLTWWVLQSIGLCIVTQAASAASTASMDTWSAVAYLARLCAFSVPLIGIAVSARGPDAIPARSTGE